MSAEATAALSVFKPRVITVGRVFVRILSDMDWIRLGNIWSWTAVPSASSIIFWFQHIITARRTQA
ncbi:hypothetical protein ACFQAT_17425 [Undibacterium arcticum]|uniref:Uncharacterized protein n=1 Tax=Undibacterium arcticum TaxID=1762892 RepID=A0ABV7F395_9BURK